MRTSSLGSVLCLSAALFAGPSTADEGAPPERPTRFEVLGEVAEGRVWSLDALRQAFSADVKEVAYARPDGEHRSRCVALRRLIEVAKPKIPAEPKRADLAFAVLVTSLDGYAACFSFGELDEALGKAQVWVALDRDGAPLSDKHAPVELLVVSDGKSSRGVRAVAKIQVLDLLAAARRP